MLCENCGKKEANVQYKEVINGKKKQVFLCEECSKKLGLEDEMKFDFPISFSSFFGDFLEDFDNTDFLPTLDTKKDIRCDYCNTSFEDFMNTGKFGCGHCYDAFHSKIDPILKKIHGSNRHTGRIGNIKESKKLFAGDEKTEVEVKEKEEKSELQKLKRDLKQAIKEERYEDAAKIRDEIKKQENK